MTYHFPLYIFSALDAASAVGRGVKLVQLMNVVYCVHCVRLCYFEMLL